MSDSIRKIILDEFKTRLSASSGKPSGLKVEGWRLTMIEEGELPHQNIIPGTETVTAVGGDFKRSPLRDRMLPVIVEARALPTSGQSAYDALDPLLQWVTKQITPAGDFTLGGKANKVEESSTEFGATDNDGPAALAKRIYNVTYQTKTADETAKA